MRHLNNFQQFDINEEHLYGKAFAKDAKKWAENYEKFIAYVKKMIESRNVKDFKNGEKEMSFTIKGRKYKLDKAKKICLYKTQKSGETEIELELTDDQYKEFVKALKKPLVSPRAAEPTYKNPQGRKPYLKEDEE